VFYYEIIVIIIIYWSGITIVIICSAS